MNTWHEVEREIVRPLEKLAKAVVKHHEMGADRDPNAWTVRQAVIERADELASHWKVTPQRLREVIEPYPDADLAPRLLGTIASERDKAHRNGDTKPDADPAWQKACVPLQRALIEGHATREVVRRAMRAAASAKAKYIAFATEDRELGMVPKKRIYDETVRIKPAWDPEWRLEGRVWVVTWRSGKGRLRFRLESIPKYDPPPLVWVNMTPPKAVEVVEVVSTNEVANDVTSVVDKQSACGVASGKDENMSNSKDTDKDTGKDTGKDTSKASDDLTAVAWGKLLDDRKVNASMFGPNGRKGGLCVLYSRNKPSVKVASGRGANLVEACTKAIEAFDAEHAAKPAKTSEAATQEASEAGGDMF